MSVETFVVAEIFSVYENFGDHSYYGEEVTQLEHASQCALAAEKEGHSCEVKIISII